MLQWLSSLRGNTGTDSDLLTSFSKYREYTLAILPSFALSVERTIYIYVNIFVL